jgi:hypothetical protein
MLAVWSNLLDVVEFKMKLIAESGGAPGVAVLSGPPVEIGDALTKLELAATWATGLPVANGYPGTVGTTRSLGKGGTAGTDGSTGSATVGTDGTDGTTGSRAEGSGCCAAGATEGAGAGEATAAAAATTAAVGSVGASEACGVTGAIVS